MGVNSKIKCKYCGKMYRPLTSYHLIVHYEQWKPIAAKPEQEKE